MKEWRKNGREKGREGVLMREKERGNEQGEWSKWLKVLWKRK